jgi:cytochrome c551/c552
MKTLRTTLNLSFTAVAATLMLLGGNAVAAGHLDHGAATADSADTAIAVLAQKSGCLACHTGAGKGNGPAYKDVAAKYAGNKNAVAVLSTHIRQGTGPNGVGWMGAGKASLPFMPANHVSKAEAQQLARWVLTIQEEIPNINRLFVTEQITVTGKVEKPLKLDPAALRQFPPQQVGEVPLVCQSGADKGKLENFKGVRLTDILDQAKILAPGHNDVKKLAIVATASDGYKAVFSWNELFNSPIGEGVMVFFEKDGQPLADNEGRIALVSSKDSRTGPRHVKWLQNIEVKKIAD